MTKYDYQKITSLLSQYQELAFEEKWQKIGDYYGVKWNAVQRWYYRNKKEQTTEEQTIEQIQTLAKTSEYWRFVCTLVTGKASKDRIPDTIRKTIHFLEKVLTSYDG